MKKLKTSFTLAEGATGVNVLSSQTCHPELVSGSDSNEMLKQVQHDRLFKRAGFTLAEVLITLGIIGVVAALTIPSLISNYKKKQYYTQFMKARSVIENAIKLYEDDGGEKGRAEYLIEALPKYVQGNIIEDPDIFENVTYKSLNGEEEGIIDDYNLETNRIFITSDGIMYWYSEADDAIYIDVNGPRNLPNTFGRDMFEIFYSASGKDYWLFTREDLDDCSTDENGYLCAKKLIREGKMNY